MKKAIALLLLFTITAYFQSCHVRKKLSKTKMVTDSAAIISNDISLKKNNTDSARSDWYSQLFKINNEFELSADKVTRHVDYTGPSSSAFVFNVKDIAYKGDSAVLEDIKTGATAVVYADKQTGDVKFSVKQKGGRSETYEMAGMKMTSKTAIDASKSGGAAAAIHKSGIDSIAQINTATTTRTEQTTKDLDKKKDFGLLKVIGLIVLVTAALRMAIYLLRKQWPWIGWLNRLLGGK